MRQKMNHGLSPPQLFSPKRFERKYYGGIEVNFFWLSFDESIAKTKRFIQVLYHVYLGINIITYILMM